MKTDKDLARAAQLLSNSSATVVVTGAGISTEAGIPDFRGPKGIYRTLGEDRVMDLLSISTFNRKPELFYEFYWKHFMNMNAKPSQAHLALAEMEQRGLIKAVVTQNIDNLHQKAGSKKVIPVHGNAGRFICTNSRCRSIFSREEVIQSQEVVPHCKKCNGVLKPDVVLFGENIYNFLEAREYILDAQLVMVIGSSLQVYPLAGFVQEYSFLGKDLVIINQGATRLDHTALVKINPPHTGAMLEKMLSVL